MSETGLYRVEDKQLLLSLLNGESGFLAAQAVLSGLTAVQASARPHGLPHSIASITAHMWFYQDYFNRAAREGFTGFPEHAEEGWPEVAEDGWDEMRERYLASIEESKRIVETSAALDQRFLPVGTPLPFLERETYGSGILHAAVHNGHHLGQVVMLRQLMGLWPPPAGSMTW